MDPHKDVRIFAASGLRSYLPDPGALEAILGILPDVAARADLNDHILENLAHSLGTHSRHEAVRPALLALLRAGNPLRVIHPQLIDAFAPRIAVDPEIREVVLGILKDPGQYENSRKAAAKALVPLCRNPQVWASIFPYALSAMDDSLLEAVATQLAQHEVDQQVVIALLEDAGLAPAARARAARLLLHSATFPKVGESLVRILGTSNLHSMVVLHAARALLTGGLVMEFLGTGILNTHADLLNDEQVIWALAQASPVPKIQVQVSAALCGYPSGALLRHARHFIPEALPHDVVENLQTDLQTGFIHYPTSNRDCETSIVGLLASQPKLLRRGEFYVSFFRDILTRRYGTNTQMAALRGLADLADSGPVRELLANTASSATVSSDLKDAILIVLATQG